MHLWKYIKLLYSDCCGENEYNERNPNEYNNTKAV